MLGTLDTNQIEAVLNNQVVGRIGCHANGVTYIVPTSFAYNGNSIYGHSKGGMKIDIMRTNPEVCFEVEIFNDMANWQTVIVWGKFVEITEDKWRRDALALLSKRHLPIVTSETVKLTPFWPYLPEDLNEIEGIVYRIDITKKTGRFEGLEVKQTLFYGSAI